VTSGDWLQLDIVGDAEAVPDLASFADGLSNAFERLGCVTPGMLTHHRHPRFEFFEDRLLLISYDRSPDLAQISVHGRGGLFSR
jgi:hypothetical protein